MGTMKSRIALSVVVTAAALLYAFAPSQAEAQCGPLGVCAQVRVSGGISFGGGVYVGGPPPPPVVYAPPPPVVYVQPAPPPVVYVQPRPAVVVAPVATYSTSTTTVSVELLIQSMDS